MIREKCNLDQFTIAEMSLIFLRARNIGGLFDYENNKFERSRPPRRPSFYQFGLSFIGPTMLLDDELENVLA